MEKEISKDANKKDTNKPTCGIIMPIGAIEACTTEHWAEVLNIIKDVCDISGFKSKMVNEAEDIGVIHKRIVENIYSSDIVVCDVSCKNSNVMFELGMRLAFDKPTIIIKDELTNYSFDTSLIEHIEYRRDLRFNSIIKFKENLGKKLTATYEKSKDVNYSTFLKNFGKYKVAHLEEKEITSDTFIINAIEDLRRDIRIIRNASGNENNSTEKRLRRFSIGGETTMESDRIYVSEKEKIIFRDIVKDFIIKNPKSDNQETIPYLKKILIELEKNDILRSIAFTEENLRKMITDVYFS